MALPTGLRSLYVDLAFEGGLYELLLIEKRNPSAGSEVVRGHCEQRSRVARVVGVSVCREKVRRFGEIASPDLGVVVGPALASMIKDASELYSVL